MGVGDAMIPAKQQAGVLNYPCNSGHRGYLQSMKIYFCPACGAYDFSDGSTCVDCNEPIPSDSWADVTEEEIAELDYAEEFELPLGLPSWEYEVVRLEAVAEDDRLQYTMHLLNSMGDKGWELVSIEGGGGRNERQYGVFKRAWLEDF